MIGNFINHIRKKLFSVKKIRWGDFRKTKPISNVFGYDRGQSINRYFIDKFLDKNINSIKGIVLEFGDDQYIRKYSESKISRGDVISLQANDTTANIICDLTKAENIASNTYDCIICTQTLQFIYDMDSAVFHLNRILKPGGTLLATFSGISQISRYDMKRWGEYWRLTNASAEQLFLKHFKKENINIKTYGNVLVAISYLHGLSSDELTRDELDYIDPDYQAFIMVQTVKSK